MVKVGHPDEKREKRFTWRVAHGIQFEGAQTQHCPDYSKDTHYNSIR
jgi:hypothetical protein